MKSKRLASCLSVLLVLLSVFSLVSQASSQDTTLECLGRLNLRTNYPNHKMDARAVDDYLAIIALNPGLALVSVHSLPVDSAEDAPFRLLDLNAATCTSSAQVETPMSSSDGDSLR